VIVSLDMARGSLSPRGSAVAVAADYGNRRVNSHSHVGCPRGLRYVEGVPRPEGRGKPVVLQTESRKSRNWC
jgi:hypothetical protein